MYAYCDCFHFSTFLCLILVFVCLTAGCVVILLSAFPSSDETIPKFITFMTSLLILGAGGHARVIAETAVAQACFSNIAFLDDCCIHKSHHTKILGLPILGPLQSAMQTSMSNSFSAAIVGIGRSDIRLHWLDILRSFGYHLPPIVHPNAWVSPSATLGAGSVVFAQASLQAQASIGIGSILNTGCSVDHDSHLSDGVHVSPGASLAGGVHVGARSWIGIGASVIQDICIGSDVTVGAGAAVINDLPNGITAVGVPATPL